MRQRLENVRNWWLAAGVVLGPSLSVGCGLVQLPGPGEPEVARTEPVPFAAESIEVHPLTRVDGSEDPRVLELYLETRDAFDDVVKAPGRLSILLYRTGFGNAAGGTEPDRTWELDLFDPAENSRYFDAATRLYRVRLAGIPSWLLEGSAARVEVVFETVGRGFELRTLRGSRQLR